MTWKVSGSTPTSRYAHNFAVSLLRADDVHLMSESQASSAAPELTLGIPGSEGTSSLSSPPPSGADVSQSNSLLIFSSDATNPASVGSVNFPGNPVPAATPAAKGFADRDEQVGLRSFSEVLTSINEHSPVTQDDVSRAREQYGSLYLRELLARQLSTRFGIVSFSTDPRHPLMWSHYPTDGSGFVIGYDAKTIRELSNSEGR